MQRRQRRDRRQRCGAAELPALTVLTALTELPALSELTAVAAGAHQIVVTPAYFRCVRRRSTRPARAPLRSAHLPQARGAGELPAAACRQTHPTSSGEVSP